MIYHIEFAGHEYFVTANTPHKACMRILAEHPIPTAEAFVVVYNDREHEIIGMAEIIKLLELSANYEGVRV